MEYLHPVDTSPKVLEALVKVEDAAQLLAVSHKTIYNLVASGELPHVRVGRAIRFAPSALRALTGE